MLATARLLSSRPLPGPRPAHFPPPLRAPRGRKLSPFAPPARRAGVGVGLGIGLVWAAVVLGAERVPRFPEAGTYDLPVIDRVGDHTVVTSDGRSASLLGLKKGRVGLVAFVYTSCTEMEGCPLSNSVFFQLDRWIGADASLRDAVALVTMSFDPVKDTPEHLAAFRKVQRPTSDWSFATTRRADALAPILADFGQTVERVEKGGEPTGVYRHVLKVFLLDREDRVRNVYSAGFLDAKLLLTDVRTLLGAEERGRSRPGGKVTP